MATGKVKWFNDAKGFGFIENDEGTEIFVHYSALPGEGRKTLEAGTEVEFDLYETAKGLQAQKVVPRSH